MKLDGATVANVTNTDPREFEDVKIFAGDNWLRPARGMLRKLIVRTM